MRLSTAFPIALALLVACDPQPDDTDEDTELVQADADLDSIPDDVDNCVDTPNADQADADEDGIGDVCDLCQLDPDNDADSDDWCANDDNCPDVANIPQTDLDADGAGDACDPCPLDAADDDDGDGFCADVDVCPDVSDDQTDSDLDGMGDACDPCRLDPDNDLDGDGICGDLDGCPEIDDDQTDTDGDGIGDACDVCTFDADNDLDDDGICADVDVCPLDADPEQLDTNGDGYGDACACGEGSYRDYTDGSCAICPAAGLTSDILDFTSADTRYDATTNTLHFALADGAEIVSATVTIRALSFDEYGYDNAELSETLPATVQGRTVSVSLDDLQTIDVYADGISDVAVTLVDACGDELLIDDLTIEAEPSDAPLTVEPLRRSVCFDSDLATATGTAIASGSTVGQGRDQSPGDLLNTRSSDVAFRWTAPNAGPWLIDTQNSLFDTVLYVLPDGCDGDVLAFDDDAFGTQSRVTVSLDAGESVVIVVAGYEDSVGEYELNIRAPETRR